MSSYRFVTTWCLEAPIDDVYDALIDCATWPEWWRGVEEALEREPGDEDGLGALWHLRWRSALPYSLGFDIRTTRVQRPFVIEGIATGDLSGSGRWRLYEGLGTAVVYEWHVGTTKAWMNLFGPLARPVFAWNHDVVMRRGGQGLAQRLGSRLLVRN